MIIGQIRKNSIFLYCLSKNIKSADRWSLCKHCKMSQVDLTFSKVNIANTYSMKIDLLLNENTNNLDEFKNNNLYFTRNWQSNLLSYFLEKIVDMNHLKWNDANGNWHRYVAYVRVQKCFWGGSRWKEIKFLSIFLQF